jgi:hypothetical protein
MKSLFDFLSEAKLSLMLERTPGGFWYAQIPRVKVQVDWGLCLVTEGQGQTQEHAIADLIKKIRGQLLVLDDSRKVEVPEKIIT